MKRYFDKEISVDRSDFTTPKEMQTITPDIIQQNQVEQGVQTEDMNLNSENLKDEKNRRNEEEQRSYGSTDKEFVTFREPVFEADIEKQGVIHVLMQEV